MVKFLNFEIKIKIFIVFEKFFLHFTEVKQKWILIKFWTGMTDGNTHNIFLCPVTVQKCWNWLEQFSGGSRISRSRGHQPSRCGEWGGQHKILPIFPKYAWNWKKLDPHWGASLASLVDVRMSSWHLFGRPVWREAFRLQFGTLCVNAPFRAHYCWLNVIFRIISQQSGSWRRSLLLFMKFDM